MQAWVRKNGRCDLAARKKIRASVKKPGPPSILTGPVHPFGSLAALSVPPSGRLRAHSFASPPHDGFAFIEDDSKVIRDQTGLTTASVTKRNLVCVFQLCKLSTDFFSNYWFA